VSYVLKVLEGLSVDNSDKKSKSKPQHKTKNLPDVLNDLRRSLGIVKKVKEDTSQSGVPGAMLFGYHKGFWTVNSGPNQPTVSIPSHQVYGQDGVTKIVGKPGMRGRIVKTKNGHAFKSDDSGGPVSNPVGGTPQTIGVNYTSRI
jgi:hypothetical protein